VEVVEEEAEAEPTEENEAESPPPPGAALRTQTAGCLATHRRATAGPPASEWKMH